MGRLPVGEDLFEVVGSHALPVEFDRDGLAAERDPNRHCGREGELFAEDHVARFAQEADDLGPSRRVALVQEDLKVRVRGLVDVEGVLADPLSQGKESLAAAVLEDGREVDGALARGVLLEVEGHAVAHGRDRSGQVAVGRVDRDAGVDEREQRGVREPSCHRDNAWTLHLAEDVLQGAREAVPGEVIEVVRQVASFRQRLDRHGHTRELMDG